MNQSVRKNSVASRSRPSPGQSANKGTIIRPKRCYNCQKMVAGDKYEEHYQSCNRFIHSNSNNMNNNSNVNNQSRANSVADTPTPSTKASTLNTTQSRILHAGGGSKNGGDNKGRLVVSNNVVIPGKPTSNITRKGPHKNIINSTIGQRKYKKGDNPEELQKKREEKVEKGKKEQKLEEDHIKREETIRQREQQKIQKTQKVQKQRQRQKEEQHMYMTQSQVNRTTSRNIRTHSRPGSATRPNVNMQIRVAQQSARLADFYNGSYHRPRAEERPREESRPHQRRVSLSSQSGYESSQLMSDSPQEPATSARTQSRRDSNPELSEMKRQQQEKRRLRVQEIQRERQRRREVERQREAERQRQRQRQRERLREIERQRQLERERQQRQRDLQWQRHRQRERQRERQQQRQRNRQMQQDRQQIQRQQNVPISQPQQPRVNLEILVQTTDQIINFVEQLALHDDNLTDMLLQLRQLNAISTQIVELNGLGRNLGFRMGVVFAQRIQELQNVIMNQIGVVLIRNFHNNITEDFQRLMSLRPTQAVIMNLGFRKNQIQQTFPLQASQTQNECSICLEQVKYRQQIRELQCKHVFHPDCIDGWLAESRKCPMCRHEQKIS